MTLNRESRRSIETSAAMNDTIQIVCPDCRAINRVPGNRIGEAPSCGRCHKPLFQGKPLALDGESFARQVGSSDVPLLVDFWAEWCGPCRMMAPHFEAAARLLEPSIRLGKVDTDAEPDLARRFAIRSIPTMILFRGGHEIARHSGLMGGADIEHWVRAAVPA